MNKIKAYFYGSCDITATITYLKNKNCVFNEYRKFHNYLSFQSSYWVESINKNEVIHPFIANGVYPDHSVFNNEKKIVIITTLCEPLIGNYIGKKHELIRFGYPHLDATKKYEINYPSECGLYGKSVFETFSKDFSFFGMTSVKQIVNNFKIIFRNFRGAETQFVVFLGPTFDSEFGEMNLLCKELDMKVVYREINTAMKEAFKEDTIHFIDPNEFYKKPKKQSDLFFYNFPSIIHYPRITYKKIAKKLHRLFPKTIKYDYFYDFKRFVRKKIKPFFVRLRNHIIKPFIHKK